MPESEANEKGTQEMLEDKSFDAVITDGRIQHEENLRPWEGEEVRVTVHFRIREIAQPDGLDIERDVYLKMPVKTTIVGTNKIRDIGAAKPSVILPEGIEDD
jgi:hypothetical protein